MKRLFNYTIQEDDKGMTVGAYLKNLGYSHHVIVHLRNTEHGISIDGKLVFTTRRLSAGETLSILLLEDTSSENILPVPMELSILYEDADLMVINKASGVPVHPSQGHHENTLANGVMAYYKERGEAFTYRAINRLDRDTTGLLIIARHMLSAAILSSMVMEKKICREYLAVVSGKTEDDGTVCKPIARVNGSILMRTVDEVRGEYACTHYKRLAYDESRDCSLLSLILETGRTHQIRVHMKAIGHPLLGDFLYHPDYRHILRQSLHSHRLTFHHPITGEHMEFTAPIPEDFHFLSPFE